MSINRLFLVLFSLATFSSCRPEEKIFDIVMSKKILSVDFMGHRDTVTLRNIGNISDQWQVVCDEKWLRVERLNDTSFVLDLTLNSSKGVRKAEVRITAPNAFGILTVFQSNDLKGVPLQTVDSMALVALYHSLSGDNWYFEGDTDPTSKHLRWDFNNPFRTWVGIDAQKIDGQYRIVSIDLTSRGIVGELPPIFDSLKYLTDFNAIGNSFSSNTLRRLCVLTKLRTIRLDYNSMTMAITDSISQLEDLEMLNLDGNKIEGDLPDGFSKLSKLSYLSLNGCGMSLSLERLAANRELVSLELSWNKISGEIPSQISNLSKLEVLNLAMNELTGELPLELTQLVKLRQLVVSNNHLSGSIPSQYGDLRNLEVFNCAENDLTKIEDDALCSKVLEHLDVSLNKIKYFGNINSVIGLKMLLASGNEIEVFASNLSACTVLTMIDLSRNNLVEIPKGINELTSLETLSLSSNKIQTVPNFSLAKSLLQLDLSDNDLSSMFPSWVGSLKKLRYLSFKDNNMIGALPSNLVEAIALHTLNVSGNRFSGAIPKAITSDARYNERIVNVKQEAAPYEWVTLRIPSVWQPELTIWPQQNGYGFTNAG